MFFSSCLCCYTILFLHHIISNLMNPNSFLDNFTVEDLRALSSVLGEMPRQKKRLKPLEKKKATPQTSEDPLKTIEDPPKTTSRPERRQSENQMITAEDKEEHKKPAPVDAVITTAPLRLVVQVQHPKRRDHHEHLPKRQVLQKVMRNQSPNSSTGCSAPNGGQPNPLNLPIPQ